MRTVDVGVGEQDDLVIARPGDVELIAHPGSDGGDEGLHLGVGQHLVDAALLHVEDLSAQGQDGLGVAVAGADGGAAGRVALDDEEFGQRGVLDRAVGQLARERGVLQSRLAAREVPSLTRGGPSLRGLDGLANDRAGLLRVLLQELGELRVDNRLDEALHARITELGFGLTLELGIGELGRDDGGQPLAHVLAGEVVVLLLELALVAGVLVQRAGQRGAKAGEMGAAVNGVDVVGVGEHRLLVGAVPLHGHLDCALRALAGEVDDLLVDGLLVAVEVSDEVDDAAVVLKLRPMTGPPLIDQHDPQPPGKEGGVAHALLERREVEGRAPRRCRRRAGR